MEPRFKHHETKRPFDNTPFLCGRYTGFEPFSQCENKKFQTFFKKFSTDKILIIK